jgi:hypothetical protein
LRIKLDFKGFGGIARTETIGRKAIKSVACPVVLISTSIQSIIADHDIISKIFQSKYLHPT